MNWYPVPEVEQTDPFDERAQKIPRGWQRWFLMLEAVAGLIATFLIGAIPPMSMFCLMLYFLGGKERWEALAAACGLVLLGVWSAICISAVRLAVCASYPEFDSLRWLFLLPTREEDLVLEDRPWPVELSRLLGTFPTWMRPLLCIWWGTHFAASLLLTFGLHLLLESFKMTPGPAITLLIGVHFAASVATNLYLILSASMFWNDEEFLCWLWESRLMIDVLWSLVVGACFTALR